MHTHTHAFTQETDTYTHETAPRTGPNDSEKHLGKIELNEIL